MKIKLLTHFLTIIGIVVLTGCGTMYREPDRYQDRRLPVAEACRDPNCAISPYSGQHVDVQGIPYNMVISDPFNGGEFLFLRPEEQFNPRLSRSPSTEPVADTPSPTYVSPAPAATRQLTAEEAQDQLVVALTARFLGTAYQPESFLGVVIKMGAQSLAESSVEEALSVLYPDNSNTERAAVRSVLISLADRKIAPEQLSQQLTKDILIAELKEENPIAAQNMELVDTTWNIVDESIQAAKRKSE